MSEVVIRARDLKKVYRLYAKPAYRFLDMFGLLGDRPGAFTEHAALDGVNLEIRRGEKVGIIGRNGAGKSTFLKLVTRVIQPTAGSLEVEGAVHALLQIGTGFHPDFTGRQNVYAYFAQLGLSGPQADRRCEEVIEFAELEEYIDQPVKTYSTGMAVRLMFSASTAIKPDLLVLDEVLGVGDAYFAHKSYERIRTLSAAESTTLLLVTHDVYTAAKVCDRMIWLDRGAVLVDDKPHLVIAGYEDSIRRQEERRLRLKRLSALSGSGVVAHSMPLVVEVRSTRNRPLPCPVFVSRLSLAVEGTVIDSLPIGLPEDATAQLVLDGTAWGESLQWEGRPARTWRNFGSVFHKIAGRFEMAGLMDPSHLPALGVEIDCWTDAPCEVAVQAFVGDRELDLGEFETSHGWQTIVGQVAVARANGNELARRRSDRAPSRGLALGSGHIVIAGMCAMDEAGRVKSVFAHGEPFVLSVQYQINEPGFHDEVQVLASFHRDGVHDTCRAFCPGIVLDAAQHERGVLEMRLPKMSLGAGKYTVSLGITERGYFDREQVLFYSINPGMYDCFTRGLEIEVVEAGIVATGTGVVVDAEWRLAATPRGVEHVRYGHE